MFVIILDGKIGVPLPMFGEGNTPMKYDNLDYMETAVSYIRNDTRMIFPLSPSCPEFEDVFPSNPDEKVAPYVRHTSELSGRWLVMEQDASFWFYAAEKDTTNSQNSSDMPKLWRERITVYDNTRALFHSSELTTPHRRTLLGAIRAGADTDTLSKIITERAIGPVAQMGWWDIGNLQDCLMTIRITKPDFRKAWRATDEGKRRVAQMEKAIQENQEAADRASAADAKPAEPVVPPAKPKRKRRINVSKSKPPTA